jgi:DNA/RNA-binding domain of Phe-tRNA-synthetase-like protein
MDCIKISPDVLAKWPTMKLACLSCNVVIEPKNENLWKKIQHVSQDINLSFEVEEISQLPSIYSARKAYRALGKDPARYRLSSEALLRRIVKGEELYQINNVVDLVNLVSIETGFSIGGYDFEKIDGKILFDIGTISEPYEAIGRGTINIDGLPILRDQSSAFGSPTTDSVRTSVNDKTQRFLMVFFAFGNHEKLPSAIKKSIDYLKEFASAEMFSEKLLELGNND